MKVTFWGVRGCIPAPGPETNRYGGNTACVTLESRSGRLLILDAGTGIIGLGRSLMQGVFGQGNGKAAILLTHSHWDHIQGFPFFGPVYVPGNRFDVYGQGGSSVRIEDIMEGQMSPHFNPVQSIRNLGASIFFHDVSSGEMFSVGDFSIRALEIAHGVTKILCFRIQEDDASFVYVPDVSYGAQRLSADIEEQYHRASLLVHDSTYFVADWQVRANRGLSSTRMAAMAAVQADVRALAPFHYDQDYDDEAVDRLMAELRRHLDDLGGSAIRLVPSREGLEIEV